MKKMAVLFVLFFTIAIINLAFANQIGMVYVVEKGDNIYIIATKIFHLPWGAIKSDIRKRKIIHPGDKITLSDLIDVNLKKKWQKPNSTPFKKFPAHSEKQLTRDKKGLEILGLNEKQIKEVMEKHRKAVKGSQEGFHWGIIKTGDEFKKILFGDFYIWHNVVINWKNTLMTEQVARVYDINNIEIWYPVACGNWAIKTKKVVSLSVVPVFKSQAEFPPVPVFKSQAEFPPVPVYESRVQERDIIGDEFDLYMGGGIYESVHYSHTSGQYGWAKGRWRPIKVKLSKTIDLGLGIFGFGGLGSGSDDQYGYWWNQWNLGLTAKLIGKSWDADFDYGLLGRLWNKGAIDLYKSEQIDSLNFRFFSAHGNFYGRRDKGKKWFPKTEINFEGRWPRNISHERSWDGNRLEPDPDDNRNVELMLTQGIYDFKLSDDLMLTPGFNLGVGRAFGLDMNYYHL